MLFPARRRGNWGPDSAPNTRDIWGSSGCVGGAFPRRAREQDRGAAGGLIQESRIAVCFTHQIEVPVLICLCSGEWRGHLSVSRPPRTQATIQACNGVCVYVYVCVCGPTKFNFLSYCVYSACLLTVNIPSDFWHPEWISLYISFQVKSLVPLILSVLLQRPFLYSCPLRYSFLGG